MAEARQAREHPLLKAGAGGTACDGCRARKVKCNRLAEEEGLASIGEEVQCTSCRLHEIKCTFAYQVKKRGPPPGQGRVINRLSCSEGKRGARRETLDSSSQRASDLLADETLSRVPPLRHRTNRETTDRSSSSRLQTGSADQSDDSLQHGRASLAGGLQDPGPSATADTSRHTDSPEQSTNHGSDYFVEFLSRPFVDVIIRLFFESVYPLLPYPHRPSFLHDIETRRETQPNQDEWCTLVVSVVGFTLVQVPNRLTGHSREQLRSLVEKCFAHCRNFFQRPSGVITVDRSVIFTCNGLIALNLGFVSISREMHGANVALMLILGLHRKQTYDQMDVLEREMKLRAWWLVYTADRSGACIEGHYPLLVEDMCDMVDLPAMIDDHDLSNPPDIRYAGQTPLLSGFHYCCKLWRRHVLHARIATQERPLTGPDIRSRIHQVEDFLMQAESLMVDCPEELFLHLHQHSESPDISTLLSRSIDPQSSLTLPTLLLNVVPSTDDTLLRERLFNIMKANIYITQQALLFMGLRYRDELLARHEDSQPTRLHQSWPLKRSSRIWRSEPDSRGDKSAVLMDLLKIMNALPVDAISVNTLPCISKIRFVASELLTELEAPSLQLDPISGEVSAENSHNRAVEYLCKYISMLSEIENLYALVEE